MKNNRNMRKACGKICNTIILATAVTQLSSCSLFFAGTGASAANTFASRRGIKGVWNDYGKRYDIIENWKKAGLTELNCLVSGEIVMLYGPKPKDIVNYIKIARETAGIDTVLDKTHEESSKPNETQDALLKFKIKTKLIANFKVQSRNYQIEVYNGTVYILGSAYSEQERASLLQIISETGGVKHIEHSIEVIDAPTTLLTPKS